jgi:hypothetical protein
MTCQGADRPPRRPACRRPAPCHRYIGDYRQRLAYLWPHLSEQQRGTYLATWLSELPRPRLVAAALHAMLLAYLLGLAMILAYAINAMYLMGGVDLSRQRGSPFAPGA